MNLANYWRDVRPLHPSVPVATAPSPPPPPPPRANPQELVLERRLPSTPLTPPKDYRYTHPHLVDFPTPPPPARPTRPYRPLGSPLAGPSNTSHTSPPRHKNNKPPRVDEELSDTMSRTSFGRRRSSNGNGMHRIFGEPPRRHLHGPPSVIEDDTISINSYQIEVLTTGNLPPRPERPPMIDPATDPNGAQAYEAEYRYELAMQQWRQARETAKEQARTILAPTKEERAYRDLERRRRMQKREEEREHRDRLKRLEREYKEERRTDVMKFAMRKQIEEMKAELARERKAKEQVKEAKEKVDARMEEDLTCAICSGVLVEVHQTNPCGHISCGTCLVNWLQTKVQEGKEPSCFLCRTTVDLRVPILPVRSLDEMVKTWVDGKNEANGHWDLYEDYLERQRRWAAWRSVHPKLFDPELFPETVPPPPPPAEERFEIPGDFPLDILDEGLDPAIGMGLIEGLFNMVENAMPLHGRRPRLPVQPVRARAPNVYEAMDRQQRPRARGRNGMFFADDFFPRVNPHTAPQVNPNRPPHTPTLVGARLRNNVRDQITEFERRSRDAERDIQRQLRFRR